MCGIAGMIDLSGRRRAPRGVVPAMARAIVPRGPNEVVLARDRAGICPLFYTVRRHDGADWLLFASEMKALFASGLVEPKADPRGLNHVFTFFAMPGPVTVFEGITCLVPGRYLHF